MPEHRCNHCGLDVPPGLDKCPNCGTSQASEGEKGRINRFLVLFVVITLFALVMVFVLPR